LRSKSVSGRAVRLLAAAVLLAEVALHRPASAEAADSVSLKFAWPSPVALRVERSFERLEQRPGSEVPPVTSTTRFVWRGTASEGKYRVAFADFEVVRAEPEPRSTDALVRLEYVSRAVEPLLPTLVVDSAGQHVDLEGLPALRERIASQYAAIPGLAKDEQARRMTEVLTSDGVLAQRAMEDWNRMVQVWHGATAEVGVVKQVDGETGNAAGSPVRNVFSYSVERRVACGDGAARDASCVRLVVVQAPSFTDARAAVRALLGFDFVSGLGAPPSSEFELEHRFVTDTHPDTLLPVRYTKEKRWSVSWNDEKGERRVVGRTDRWTYGFTPIDPPKPAP
jgi:hypothetical protein